MAFSSETLLASAPLLAKSLLWFRSHLAYIPRWASDLKFTPDNVDKSYTPEVKDPSNKLVK